MQPDRPRTWYDLVMPLALIIGLVLLLNFETTSTTLSGEEPHLLERSVETVVRYLAALAELAAATVIGVAIIQGVLRFALSFFRGRSGESTHLEATRLRLGRSLVLGLEFTVASDILRTAVAPTREDLLTLGVVVMLRTLLNSFLEREIRDAEERRRAREVPALDEI